MNSPRPRAVVVGAGIAGLAAAQSLADTHDVLVLEAADRVGGKLRRDEVAGTLLDTGAEAMLNRRPEGVELASRLGLELVHPSVASAQIWTRGALRPLPRSLMGVPLDLESLQASGVLSPDGLARVRREPELAPYVGSSDPSMGDLVADRLGQEVVDRLVEPLLGGVYAGRAHQISAAAALPVLLDMVRRGSLVEQASQLPVNDGRPVFAGIRGGMGRLPDALVRTGRFAVRTDAPVRSLTQLAPHRFRLTVGPTTHPELVDADRVVLATPAAPTARLLRVLAPRASSELADLESASVAVVTLAFRRADLPTTMHDSSGFLVPPMEGRAIKAATFSVSKWDWVAQAGHSAGDLAFLRTSLGRHGEESTLQVEDHELVRRSCVDLAAAVGLVADPVDSQVRRWGGGLPQYAPGHLDRVARIRAAVARVPGLSVCGAAYDGVGIPAVISSARRATMEP